MSNYSGTICCVTGSELASSGESFSYTYSSNRNNTTYNWSIVSGSISIISGGNAQTVTVEFGNDFTSGVIKCDASGELICDALIEVNR